MSLPAVSSERGYFITTSERKRSVHYTAPISTHSPVAAPLVSGNCLPSYCCPRLLSACLETNFKSKLKCKIYLILKKFLWPCASPLPQFLWINAQTIRLKFGGWEGIGLLFGLRCHNLPRVLSVTFLKPDSSRWQVEPVCFWMWWSALISWRL